MGGEYLWEILSPVRETAIKLSLHSNFWESIQVIHRHWTVVVK